MYTTVTRKIACASRCGWKIYQLDPQTRNRQIHFSPPIITRLYVNPTNLPPASLYPTVQCNVVNWWVRSYFTYLSLRNQASCKTFMFGQTFNVPSRTCFIYTRTTLVGGKCHWFCSLTSESKEPACFLLLANSHVLLFPSCPSFSMGELFERWATATYSACNCTLLSIEASMPPKAT